jgi:predicted MFS family arabinose efflux permease
VDVAGLNGAARERPGRILPVIIVSQFAGTALWFAGNAVVADLQEAWGLADEAVGHVTSAVQLGFIAGTLVFAFFAIADRYSPRNVFLLCSILGAAFNLGIYFAHDLTPVLASRFMTGFFLAGIYPVGMKIAAGWYQRDLGNAIGFLVGALVLGTAFPHLLKALGHALPWHTVTLAVSVTAAGGGLLMWACVADGPYSSRGARFDPRAIWTIFGSARFRASAFGYFGHMWELYAFWAYLPVVLAAHAAHSAHGALDVSLWSFLVIAAGALGCAGGGLISLRRGSAPVAFVQLLTSGVCCIASPLLFHAPTPVFISFLLLWGITVVGDSPQFSTLNAQNAPKALVGSALTIANCIGFAITIPSIQLLTWLAGRIDPAYLYLPLAAGPLFGLAALWPLLRERL